MKKLFSFSFAILVIVAFLLGGQIVKNTEYLSPLGTSTSFELYLGNTSLSKQVVVTDLQQIAMANDAIILKPNTDAKTYGSKRDLYYFSPKPPKQGVPVVSEGGHLSWFSEKMSGQLRAAYEIGEAPLSGTYYVSHSVQLENALTQWAQQQGLTLRYQEPPSALSRLYIMVTQTGLGISYVAVLLLTLALVITDVLRRAYLRSVQFLNGINPVTIHRQQFLRVASWGLLGALCGVILCSVYEWITHSLPVLGEVVAAACPFILGGIALILVVTAMVSLLFAPTSKVIRTRKLPTMQYRLVNLGIQIVAVAICVMATVASVGLGKTAVESYRIQLATKSLGESVAVSFKTFEYLDSPSGIKDVQTLLSVPALEDSSALSLNIGSSIQVDSQELGNYDELDIVNRHFLELAKLSDNSLLPVTWESLAPRTRDFLGSQLPLWLTPGTDFHKAFSFYTVNGKSNYISLDANVGYGGEVNTPARPLVIVVNLPLAQLKSGFTIPAISSGNIVFTKPALIKDHLYSSSLASSIRSIDRVADAGLISAQYFKSQVTSYLVAIMVSLTLIIVAAWQSAVIWAKEHKQYIFIAKTSGVKPKAIYGAAIKRSMIFTSIAGIVGAAVSVFNSGYSSMLDGVITLVVMIGVFWLVSAVSYAHTTKQTFADSVLRKE